MILTACFAAVTPFAAGGPHGPDATRWRPAGFHAVAYVTDWRSHGQVGDAFLSVNEAIQLHNGTLSFAALSLAESNQLSLIPGTGSTTDVTWIDIDGSSTPVITVEQDFDPIIDTTFGCLIKGFNDAPVLDFSGTNITHGFRVPANSVNFEDLILSGGPYGVDVTQADASGQAGAAFDNVTFDGQAQFGLRVTGTSAGGIGRVVLGDCSFVNVPQAIVYAEPSNGRTTIFEAYDVSMRNVGAGVLATLGPGGTARFTFDGCDFETTGTAIDIQRPPGADRTMLVEGKHVRLRGAVGTLIAGSGTSFTQVDVRMWNVIASSGEALGVGALGDRIFGIVEDCTFAGTASAGTVRVLAGGGPADLLLRNLRCSGGSVSLGATGSHDVSLEDSRLVGANLQTSGSRAIAIAGCSFENGTATGTAAAAVVADGCHLPNPGAFVQSSNSVPTPQLGSMDIQPETVPIGSIVNLQADLPAGLFGVFVLGFTDPFPQLLPAPLHVYTMPSLTFVLPGIYRFQQSFAWSVPNSFAFVGFDLCAQIAVLPDPNVQAPPIHFPPGRRFVLR